MKYLIVALILGAFFTFIYLRLRPYIGFARRVLGVFREARGMSAGQGMPGSVAAAGRKPAGDERLVRCASCGTWLPASRALTLRATSSNFCSHACMERSAGESSTRRAAGGQH
ncbi:MAG TPA: hypothetical protein VK388_16285 [Pyrinomonadaceae bacterium]|nr:hypothetical protein [Pyrinomonadaceae bacterium]